jgi:hypothetical protein
MLYSDMRLENRLRAYGPVPLRHAELDTLLSEYRRPNDKISEWVSQGVLIRLMKGMYVPGPDILSAPLSKDVVANRMWGPSAVSMETVLSREGWIPESVTTTTSVTLRPNREIRTPLGVFSYVRVPVPWYRIGLRSESGPSGLRSLSVVPEKALCDWIAAIPHPPTSRRGMMSFLLEDARIPEEVLALADLSVIRDCVETGRKSRVMKALLSAMEAMR